MTSFDDDVWLVSYPKSGNTWTRFLIANLTSGGERIDWTNIDRRVPDIYQGRDSQYQSLPRPRYFKSHEAYKPEYRRVVFIVRDPRDVAVSYFHFVKKLRQLPMEATIDDFMDAFIAGRTDPYGSWGENVGSWLGARRGSKDFIVVRYEDLMENTERELTRIAEMLSLNVNAANISRAVENSRADRLREMEQNRPSTHKVLKKGRSDIPFVRSATSGQWQSALTAENARQIQSAWGSVMQELGYSSV